VKPGRAALGLAVALFFASGALGLGYELLWLRKAALMVGASEIALSTVLTAFFLGLALGSETFGSRLGAARTAPLALYGRLELGVGVYALAFPWLFQATKALYGAAYPLVADLPAGLFALRFTLLVLLFLPPTFLMGGTLPLLLDGLVGHQGGVGSRTGLLYGVNILGAVAGVLLTGYVAIPALGVEGTSLAGGAGNLAIGLAALIGFRRTPPAHEPARAARVPVFFCAAAAATGLLSIGYQVCWARYFSLFSFTSAQFTALFLAVYLLALAAGSLALAPLLRARFSPLAVLGLVQALAPALTVLLLGAWRLAEHRFVIAEDPTPHQGFRPLATFELAPDQPRFFHLFGENADAVFVAPLLQIALVLFVPVLLLGAALPALIAAAAGQPAELRAVSGRLVFWNTVGAALGGFLAGYVLLPLLGLGGALIALGLGSLALFVAVWRRHDPARSPRLRRAGQAAALASVAALAVLGARGEGPTREALRHHLTFQRDAAALEFVAVEEGPLTTAYVTREGRVLRLGSGSLQMGHMTEGELGGQALAGHFPVLFYPGRGMPRRGLGVCLGSGQTFGALLSYPLESLDVVEISGEISHLAERHLGAFNRDVLRDPRVRLHVDDGRHFVERAPAAAYDLVSLEAPPPTADGVYVLYSEEFFREVRRVLAPDGVFVHVLPLYFLTPRDVRAVIETLTGVFPHTFVAKVTLGDYLLLAYPQRPSFSREAIAERTTVLSREWTSRGQPPGRWWREQTIPLDTLPGVVSTVLAGPEALAAVESPVVLRDDRQLLSYGLGDRWLARRYQGNPLIHVSFTAIPVAPVESLAPYFAPPLEPQECATIALARNAVLWDVNVRDPQAMARKAADLARAADPRDRLQLALSLALDHDAALRKAEAWSHVEAALDAAQGRPEIVAAAHQEAVRKIARNRLAVFSAEAEAALARFAARGLSGPLLAAAAEEVAAYRARRAAVARRYLFGGPQ